MENLQRIIIGGKAYPFKIDLNVLEHIQNEYGTIYEFERELMGIHYEKNMDGGYVMTITEPSIRAIKTVLPAAINEGLAIEADEANRPLERLEPEFIIRNCTIPYRLLGTMLHEEFKRCFVTKK